MQGGLRAGRKALPATLRDATRIALVDLLDRLKFKGKRDTKDELPAVLALLQGRGFRLPEAQQETLQLRKCLESLESGKTDTIPEEYLLTPKRPAVITPGPTISEVDIALRDRAAPETPPAVPQPPDVHQLRREVQGFMSGIAEALSRLGVSL